MNNMYIKLVGSILAIGLITGCSSKNENVAYENSTSKVDSDKNNKVNNIKSSDSTTTEAMTKDVVKNASEVSSVINGKTIILNSVHFGFDKYKLSDEMMTTTNNNSEKINEVILDAKNVKVKLEGNCDEWGTDEYNYALGLKRTKTIKNALIKNGISSDRIVVVSYGESNPSCTKQTAKCWKQNRRVDHKLLP
ncbi:MAG TPA: hypothetical protein EYG97_04005 [Arcobacter sp.]|nr:hypothetical protein [Arcobacter sp.]HIP56167.1 hypothetical protein [Arcobacter sp.]